MSDSDELKAEGDQGDSLTIWRCNDCGKTGGYPSGKSSHEDFLGHDVDWYTPHHHDDE